MRPGIKTLLVAGLLAALSAIRPAPAAASDLAAFNAAVAEASGGYRAGLFYLHTRNPGLASLELANAADAWQSIAKTFAGDPPAAFAHDPKFAATLTSVAEALAKGTEQADAGDTKAAQATLLPIRDELFELRRRNGVDVYADCVTELNRQMDVLYVYRHNPPDLNDPNVVKTLKAAGDAYTKILARCRKMAPASYTKADEFQRLYDGTAHSVSTLAPAADTGNPRTVINVLRELRSFDRMIFLRWG